LDEGICRRALDPDVGGGIFKVIEKVANKRSNRYGKIYDGRGKLVARNAATLVDSSVKGAFQRTVVSVSMGGRSLG